MTDHEYRTLPRFANSDLSELSGKIMKAKPETLTFGSAFHGLVLEPHKVLTLDHPLTELQYYSLERMQATVRGNIELAYLIHKAEKEQVRTWICPLTGLPLKAKLDITVMPRRNYLMDLKTTSCASQEAFLKSIEDYDYDRQAAYYLSSDTKASYFEFIGIQKMAPYGMFRVLYHKTDTTIKRGISKMNTLLKLAATHYENPNGWRPSSWSRKPEMV